MELTFKKVTMDDLPLIYFWLNERVFFFLFIFFISQTAFANCDILASDFNSAKNIQDPIAILLSSSPHCPQDVFEFRALVKNNHLNLKTTMVANRGFHNPKEGSFSFFEMITGQLNNINIQSGDFFIGHFTTVNESDELTADQGTDSRLMIEAFAWDPIKELFNFYELINENNEKHWFYRGDSSDIYADNVSLHRQIDPAHPVFGERLRCSGCHGAGGPIMKELDVPHNDWWESKRKLDFGGRKINDSIKDIIDQLVSADKLSESVILGIKKLENNKNLSQNSPLTLQEKLRPLFCPVEVNFISDDRPNEENSPTIHIPSDFFINSRLIHGKIEVTIERSAYEKALIETNAHFPETALKDADHAWLAPLKATSDMLAIAHLIQLGIINEKFADDVLSVDMTNPVFSPERCQLLKYIPDHFSDHWQDQFIKNLKSSSEPSANILLTHLLDASHKPSYHQKVANKFMAHCLDKLKNPDNVRKLFLLLAQRRAEIKSSEISKNHRGQILEPGFRVIFPEIDSATLPNELILTDECEVVSRRLT